MNKCKDCRFWYPNISGFVVKDALKQQCLTLTVASHSPEKNDDFSIIVDSLDENPMSEVITSADFGCTQFKHIEKI